MKDAKGRYRIPHSRWKRVARVLLRKRGRRMKNPKATF